MRPATAPLLVGLGALVLALAPGLWGLEAEVGVTLTQSHVAVVPGPPGTPTQEVTVDRARLEAVVGHQQPLGWGWTVEALGRAGVDTLPSGDPGSLPPWGLDPSSALLEGWLGWEPLPGTLALGVGKRRVQPSSGFAHQPLDELARTDDREGRTGAQVAWFGDGLSASVFAGQAFVVGRVGATVAGVDLKAQVVRRAGAPRLGVGVDGGWGDHLTLRAEACAGSNLGDEDALAGVTWTGDDLSTLMAEALWNGRDQEGRPGAFVRATTPLGRDGEANAWVKAEAPPGTTGYPGWSGVGLVWTTDRWELDAHWTAAWGPDPGLRWQTEVVTKVFLP